MSRQAKETQNLTMWERYPTLGSFGRLQDRYPEAVATPMTPKEFAGLRGADRARHVFQSAEGVFVQIYRRKGPPGGEDRIAFGYAHRAGSVFAKILERKTGEMSPAELLAWRRGEQHHRFYRLSQRFRIEAEYEKTVGGVDWWSSPLVDGREPAKRLARRPRT